jgi:hypothetical protein
MKRTFICVLALMGLACGNTSKSSIKNGTGGVTSPAGGEGGAGAVADTGGSAGSISGDAADSRATGGAVAGDTVGAGGTPGTGGLVGLGGRAGAGSAGRTGIVVGGATSGGRGGAGGVVATGGLPAIDAGASIALGGSAGQGGGGATSTPGIDGGAGTMVTNPVVKDPTTAAADLPRYYISTTGKDSNTGTSPEQAWATVTNLPKDKASAVFFERGGTYSAAGAPAVGRDGPAAFNITRGSVWTAYGDGSKRPILWATEKTSGKPTGAVVMPGGSNLISGLSINGQANFGILLQSDGNIVQDCEIDGNITGTQIQLGFSVRGHHNLIVGNTIHDLHEVILDSGDPNTSGGAEAIVVNGTDHEVAYNSITNCWCPNETLGGAEGGCLEIIARSPGEVVENINFHHNYCERSVGLFEACAGNFDGTSLKIQEHHAVVRNTTLAYNVVVDAMWLYLLQTVNTDMDHLVFEHNTLVHGPANDDIPQQGAAGFGNFYDTDRFIPAKSCSAASDCGSSYAVCLGGSCAYQTKALPGQIFVRNNLFVVLEGAAAATMKLPPGSDDVVGNIFSPKVPTSVTASTGKVTVASDPVLVKTFRLGPNSPAIDKASNDSVKPWVDYDGHTVPCGKAADVGAIEYCP